MINKDSGNRFGKESESVSYPHAGTGRPRIHKSTDKFSSRMGYKYSVQCTLLALRR